MFKKSIVLFFLVRVLLTQAVYGQEKNWTNKDTCLSYLEIYSSYWKKDSLGKNGFRELMANCILDKCNLKGIKWSDISNYFGRPNIKFSLEGIQYYRYRLNYQGKSIKEIGTSLLTIGVDKSGLIVGFSVSSVDG